MSHDDPKQDDDRSSSGPSSPDSEVDDALRQVFNPILEEPIPPNISELLDALGHKKKQAK